MLERGRPISSHQKLTWPSPTHVEDGKLQNTRVTETPVKILAFMLRQKENGTFGRIIAHVFTKIYGN